MCDVPTRTSAFYRNLSSRFSRKTDDYNNQFYKIYNIRLDQMNKYILEAIKTKWGDKYRITKLYKLAEESDDICVVIGTLFKDQKLKPSVLKQLAESNQLMPQPILAHCTDVSDVLYIEDELQRFKLEGLLDGKYLVTGITCALLGRDKGDGKFEVVDYTFAGYRPQLPKPLMPHDIYVVLASGLDITHLEQAGLNLRLFVSWISGYLSDLNDINVGKIARLIIAGNSVRTTEEEDTQIKFTMSVRTNQNSELIETIRVLDVIVSEFCQVIDVDLMPGRHDLSNFVLPQKSLHHCMFPKSLPFSTFHRVTNPYECEVNGVRFLGTSGEPIADILKYSDILDPMDALQNCLMWNHLAPTAPDTLASYPYYDNDPFIIEECPHVLFAGNQQQFDSRIIDGPNNQLVRLICIPEFVTTSTTCIVNLRNLECIPVMFVVE